MFPSRLSLLHKNTNETQNKTKPRILKNFIILFAAPS